MKERDGLIFQLELTIQEIERIIGWFNTTVEEGLYSTNDKFLAKKLENLVLAEPLVEGRLVHRSIVREEQYSIIDWIEKNTTEEVQDKIDLLLKYEEYFR